jgi:putative oxidoreductase
MNITSRIVRTNASLWSPLALRLALGAIMAGHGAKKIFGWFGGDGFEATVNGFASMGFKPALLWAGLAAGGEFFGGLLLILGLFTRLAALNTAVIMAVAAITAHASSFFLPSGMEFTLILFAASLVLVETGGGALSIDSKIGNGISTIKS